VVSVIKIFGGFLIGFSLATLLFFGFVYLQFSSLRENLKSAVPAAKFLSDSTNSSEFQDAVAAVALIPFVGSTVGKTLSSVQAVSKVLAPALQELSALLDYSLPAIAVSIVGIMSGAFLIFKEDKKLGKQEMKYRTEI
jgi:hypothetical protein